VGTRGAGLPDKESDRILIAPRGARKMRAMTTAAIAILLVALCLCAVPAAEGKGGPDTRIYEMRTYYAAPGKLEALNARFRDHTCKLFEKHGITNVGYWEPVDNPENKLVYVIAYPSREAHQERWKAFQDDPEWKKAKADSEAGGKLVEKVETVFLTATDYSPPIKPAKDGDRAFELRVYTASEGNLGRLNERFRDHTCKLFEKHGMTNVGYWTPMKDQKGADDTLIYILAHKSVDSGKANFDAFRKDPNWLAARKASEDKAGGPLTVKDGVKSTYMKATDYSPIR
jgi:hypothetical protein